MTLNPVLHYNQYLQHLNQSEYKPLLDSALAGERPEVAENIRSILANVFAAEARDKRLCVSMRRKSKGDGVLLSFISAVNSLTDRGFLELEKGVKGFDGVKGSGQRSTVRASSLLKQYFKHWPAVCEVHPERRLVELRDSDGKALPIPARSLPAASRGLLRRVNAILRRTEITYASEGKTVTHNRVALCRRYKHDKRLTLGGRWYHSGQSLTKQERATIGLNGERTVELDYSGLHTRLLYAEEGIQFDLTDDVYHVEGIPRAYCKKVMQSLLFDRSPRLAAVHLKGCQIPERVKAYYEHKEALLYNPRKRRPSILHEGFEPLDLSLDVDVTIKALLNKHHRIESHFSKEHLSLRLQNTDSKIAELVLSHFTDMKVAVVPVHDSFIVAEQYGAELLQVMAGAFSEVTGGFECPIT